MTYTHESVHTVTAHPRQMYIAPVRSLMCMNIDPVKEAVVLHDDANDNEHHLLLMTMIMISVTMLLEVGAVLMSHWNTSDSTDGSEVVR